MLSISRKSATRGTAAAVGALAIVGAIASSSTAAGQTYTVSVGSTVKGSATISGTSNQTLQFVDIDATPQTHSVCTSATSSGKAKLTTKAKATKIATISKSSFTGCKANGQLDLAVAQVGTWQFNAIGATSGGITSGTLSNVVSNVHDTDGLGCTFTIGGTVDATYNNANGALNFAPLSGTSNYLLISKQAGNCLGLVVNGHRVSFTGGFTVTSTKPAGTLSVVSN